MEKAFDFKELGEMLKLKGVDVAEELLKVLAVTTIDWVEKSLILTESKFDDLAIPVAEQFKQLALAQIDKLDGKVG